MSDLSVVPKPSDLAKAWALPRSSDLRQMTLRLPSEIFLQVRAIEEMYPHRNRNELVADLLVTALGEFVESLPQEWRSNGEIMGYEPDGTPVEAGSYYGPRANFQAICDRLRREDERRGGEAQQQSANLEVAA
jgi:hypothetical protein